jgi:hypothetical protein
MKILLGILAAVALVGAIWYFGMSYRLDVGVSPTAPLGNFDKLDKALTGKGLRKETPAAAEVKSLFGDRIEMTGDMIASAYIDLVPGLRHQVVVLRRPDGRIAAVCSHFRSGSFDFSKTGTKAENFAALYWIALAGSEPKFTKESEGGSDRREYLLARAQKGTVDALWRKEGAGATMQIPHEIADTVTFVAR